MSTGQGTILVVDDDPDLLRLVTAWTADALHAAGPEARSPIADAGGEREPASRGLSSTTARG